ncbi:MAG TPA: hypothetical protein VF550_04785 [Polyangia bacterium]
MRPLRWLLARLESPRAGPGIILIAIVLALPSIASPYFIDEYMQTSKWTAWHKDLPRPGRQNILNDYYVFADESTNRLEMERLGVWWMAPDFKVAFWRPLAAATHVVDHVLWPGNRVAIHLHGLAWFAAFLVALHFFFRRFLPPRLANLALALYAWDDARGMVLSWIANRHALVGGFLGVCTLIAHDRWRRERWRLGAWLAPLLLALGLLSSEMALSTTAFLFGHALFVDEGPLPRRLARLIPSALVVAAWQAAYIAGAFGAVATAGYTYPLSEPFAYVAKLFERAPIYLLGQLTPFDSMIWGLTPPVAKFAIYLLALAVLAIVARVTWPRLAENRQSRFWLVGAGLSLLLITTSAPWDRNLVFVGLGVTPALALLFASMVDKPASTRWPRFVVAALAVFNLVLGPLAFPPKCLTVLGLSKMLPSPDASISRDPAIAQKTLVIPWLMFEAPLWFTWSMRDAEGIPKPGKTRILGVSFGDVSVTRLDPVTLRLRPQDGFFPSDSSKLFRSSSRPYHAGEVVNLSNMTATITELTDDRRPQTVEFRFATPLESPEWLWMRGVPSGLAEWTPPKVGETVLIATR